jgi:hypothetical protein
VPARWDQDVMNGHMFSIECVLLATYRMCYLMCSFRIPDVPASWDQDAMKMLPKHL